MADISELLSGLTIHTTAKRTGLIFDEEMIQHLCLWDSNHIETPNRLICALERCRKYDLICRCLLLTPRFAKQNELELVHTKEYIELIKSTQHITDVAKLENLASNYDSVYFHPKTYDCAMLSAGSVLELVSSVLDGKIKNGAALVRPPGHHAMRSDACGFCFFNNVAVAAKHAIKNYNLERILIIDWDVHHGQATQYAFYDDPRVLYFSIHRYEYGAFWPNLRESNFDYIGDNLGKGYNINIPLNKKSLGNTEYLAIFHNVLLPIAFEFNPQLVLISAGYDAAIGCPEGEMEVSPYAYAHLLNEITGLAEGHICVILEGGYCLPSLAEGVAVTLKTLLGDPCPPINPTGQINESVIDTILNVITVLRPMWKCLSLQRVYDTFADPKDADVNRKKHVLSRRFDGPLTPLTPPYETRGGYPVQEPSVRMIYETCLASLISNTDLSVPEHRTCLVYDERMTKHSNKKDKSHPEIRERIMVIKEKLEKSGLTKKCLLLEAREATAEELALVHSYHHIDIMKSTVQMRNRDINKLEKKYESVYLSQETYNSAVIASGSLLQVVDAVVTGKCVNGFAIIRPPGHHAEIDEACGFCIFNSVAVAAKYAINKYSSLSKPVKKVLILDWDIHHGNGTQHVYYDDCNVLYISLHRYDNGSFFPSDEDAASHRACGSGDGVGFNINIPWNGSVGDGDYLAAFSHIVLPVAYEFHPDLVLVSSGFDAAVNDPLGECKVSPSFYGQMVKLLSSLANGKIILALEGGYNLPSVSEAAYHCVNTLLGEPCPPLSGELYPSPSAVETIQNVILVHEKFWKCLRFGIEIPYIINSTEFSDDTLQFSPDFQTGEISVQSGTTNNDQEQNKDEIYDTSLKFYCIQPLDNCPHLSLFVGNLPESGLDPFATCEVCHSPQENWVCLHCYRVLCGRYMHEHMLQHSRSMEHFLTLSYSDFSVWCYECDSYVHNSVFTPVKQHIYFAKYGVFSA